MRTATLPRPARPGAPSVPGRILSGAVTGAPLRVAVAGLLLLLPATPVSAQWVEEPGRGWTSLAVYHQDTRTRFDLEGERTDYGGDGHSVATQAFLTVATGLVPGVDAWAQLSFQRLRYDDVQGRRTSTGFGDIRLYLRVSPFRWLGSAVPVAVRAGTKLPVGDFDVGSSVIPLGDGQRDWELMVEAGHSFHPRSLYLMGWAGYRWREAKVEGRQDYGNERFFYAAAGGRPTSVVEVKVALEGWSGETPLFNGLPAHGQEREMLRVASSLLLDAGPGQVEVGARYPLGGMNLPAAWDLVLGYFTRFELP